MFLVQRWSDLQFHDNAKQQVKKPDELQNDIPEPPTNSLDEAILDRIVGSMIGLALGDALGAPVEFRPREYLCAHPLTDLQSGGTYGLEKGQVLK